LRLLFCLSVHDVYACLSNLIFVFVFIYKSDHIYEVVNYFKVSCLWSKLHWGCKFPGFVFGDYSQNWV